MRVRKLLLSLAVVLAPLAVRADVKPNALCSEGMVLQQKAKSKIWGTADKGEKVTVTFRGKDGVRRRRRRRQAGSWPSRPASRRAVPADDRRQEQDRVQERPRRRGLGLLRPVEHGVVGQRQQPERQGVGQGRAGQPDAAHVHREEEPAADADGRRRPAPGSRPSPKTVGGFSAVGYFFGRDLQKTLKVPVGLIHTSWGGTRAEAWTSKAVLDGMPEFKHEHENFGKQLEAFKNDPQARRPRCTPTSPSVLYNGMIHPILNYASRGRSGIRANRTPARPTSTARCSR